MEIKLTQYSHGAGCGCKISPKVLGQILESNIPVIEDKQLLVGNETRDDAAVYDMGNGTAIISTTDFFLPIVDDPFTFGQIAATNAISDIYAMGGKPLMAIAILGWPIDKIAPEVAQKVLEGGRDICTKAGISLAGGHSIDNPEPIFGLAVTGIVDISNLKRNDKAQANCKLYLTKPLGIGILATAQKKGLLKDEHLNLASNSMIKINDIGIDLSKMEGVTALTDVTGFGLLGHLLEVCEGSNISAILNFNKIPIFDEVNSYLKQGCIPGGANRNWDSYGHKVDLLELKHKNILCDPQTSGGLLIAVKAEECNKVEELLKKNGLFAQAIGETIEKTEKTIQVIE